MEIVEDNEYVTREIHDLQLERIELLIERNMARQEAIAAGLRADIAELRGKVDGLEKKVDERINGLEKKVDERINGLEKKVDERINGLEKKVDARIDGIMDAITLTNIRIDDLKSAQSNNIAKWGIIIAVGICAVQIISSVILHFWK